MPEESAESCRCCIKPSSKFVKLSTKSNFDGAEQKSYHEVLQEITRTIIISSEERGMPQSICRKCLKQLKNVYSFMQQTQNTYDYYRGRLVQEVEETKDFEQLHETLIEIPERKSTSHEDFELEVKEDCCKPTVGTTNIDIFINTLEDLDDDFKVEFDETLIEIPETKSNSDKDFQLEVKADCSKPAVGTKNTDIFINTLEDLDDDVNVEFQDKRSINENDLEGFLDEGDSDSSDRLLAFYKRPSHMPEDNKMPCPLCSYKASRSSALKVHMRLIHDERGHQRPKELRKHIRKKHKTTQLDKQQKRKEKPPKEKSRFLCAFCGQSYKWKKDLIGHQHTHTGERPHECDICHKTFKRRKDLNGHRVVHSDEKPFQCSQCSKAFKLSGKLKMHMRVHSELRPYKCTVCEKSFKYPCVLRAHMYMHSGQSPFSCNTCGEAFSLRRSLNDHCLKNGHVQ